MDVYIVPYNRLWVVQVVEKDEVRFYWTFDKLIEAFQFCTLLRFNVENSLELPVEFMRVS